METQRRFQNAGPSLPELVRSYVIPFLLWPMNHACRLRLGLSRAMLPHPHHPNLCPWMDDSFHKPFHRLILNHYRIRQYLLYDPAISHKCCKCSRSLSIFFALPAYLIRRLDDSLNQSLYKVKQLEGRLQMTEISNRALLEEVIRLQTELFNAVRR